MVVGGQKGSKWLWKSSVTKEVWEVGKKGTRIAQNCRFWSSSLEQTHIPSSEPLTEHGSLDQTPQARSSQPSQKLGHSSDPLYTQAAPFQRLDRLSHLSSSLEPSWLGLVHLSEPMSARVNPPRKPFARANFLSVRANYAEFLGLS